MTTYESARIREVVGLQIGKIRDAADHLKGDDLEQLENGLTEVERVIHETRSVVEGLPHKHQG